MNYALSKTATMASPTPITIPTQPIGRIPRLVDLGERVKNADREDRKLASPYDLGVRDPMERFAGSGSPVVTDGEQRKHHNFCTYCVHGLLNTAQALLQDSVFATVLRAASPGHARPPLGRETLGGTVHL
jgi:hypothetical protein